MDEEVDRLRNLRRRALQLRALGLVFTATPSADGAPVRASLLAWRIAKIITGHLRAHPNQSVRREPGILETSLRWFGVHMAALRWRSEQGRERRLLAELEAVKRTLEDVRSLTRSATLSDSRNSTAAAPLTICARVPLAVFPTGGWKKQGRISPFASHTADTHGALQRGAVGASSP